MLLIQQCFELLQIVRELLGKLVTGRSAQGKIVSLLRKVRGRSKIYSLNPLNRFEVMNTCGDVHSNQVEVGVFDTTETAVKSDGRAEGSASRIRESQ